MILELRIDCGYCTTEKFSINGVKAHYDDFGCKENTGSDDDVEEGGCGNMEFISKESTPDILYKYCITEDEYEEICVRLTEGLSFGRCSRCV